MSDKSKDVARRRTKAEAAHLRKLRADLGQLEQVLRKRGEEFEADVVALTLSTWDQRGLDWIDPEDHSGRT